MKFIRSPKADAPGHSYAFHITQREKDLLLATLRFFPQLDAGYHQISRNPKTAGKAEQELLLEAMDQQRQDHKRKLSQFFSNDRGFFKQNESGLRLTLTSEQMEWLLRVLNEIRVGSWVRLGRPEMEAARRASLSGQRAHLFSAMELSGYFQMSLLEAFN